MKNSNHLKHKASNHLSRKLRLAAMVASTLAFSQTSLAGAWVSNEGNGYGKLSYNDYHADEFKGDNTDFGEFNARNVTYYGEYGIGNLNPV